MNLENAKKKLVVTESPHMRSGASTTGIMLDVIIALIPSLIAGIIVFGYRSLMLSIVCIVSCMFFEGIWCKIIKKPSTVCDLSAAVTGLLLSLNMPVTAPFWLAIIGSLFAIIIVKQFFAGIGHNFMNPALAARAFLLTSWAGTMTTWVAPFTKVSFFNNADAISSATPLALINGSEPLPTYLDLFLGKVGGCIGEVSSLAILIGATYLIWRKVISIRIPATYILTVAALTFVFGGESLFSGDALYHILSGGLLLGAFFMATDYVTTPCTHKGQIVFGIGCGILTAVIRLWGGYPEGVTYSILLMNVATPLIDRYIMPKRFGVKGGARNAE